jgi:TolB-like protein
MRLKPTLLLLPTAASEEGESPDTTGLEQVVTDRLTRAFCRSPMLYVISPMSARTLRGRHLEQAELYRRFRADYLLQTSLVADSSGERVRLHASLWRRGAAEPVWTDESTGTALDTLSADSNLLGRLVDGVGQRILNVEQRLAQHSQSLPNLASHTLYLNAVDQLHRFSTAAFENSQRLLLALHERAPRHAEPLAWLARWHVFKVVQGWSADSRRDGMMALDYSQRALDSDPTSALALTMAGSVYAGVKRDAATAQRLYEQALTHDPNDSLAWLMSGVAQGFLNEGEPALAASETALGLAPVDPTRHYYDSLSATTALRAGQHVRCVALAERAIQANVTHGSAYRSKAIAEWLLDRQADSKHTIRRLLSVEPHFTVQHFRARVPEQDPRREEFARILLAAGLPAE